VASPHFADPLCVGQPRNIVVGYDGSNESVRALDRAASLTGYGTALAVVSVCSTPNGGRPLDDARRRLQSRQVSAAYVEAVGDRADELLRVVRSRQADLLIVPLSDCRGLLEGSPCDVLVVR
jgi:nucleotide-binding universal stress UspA family protein